MKDRPTLLREALQAALTACSELQNAIDREAWDEATEWLESLSDDATSGLKEVWKVERL